MLKNSVNCMCFLVNETKAASAKYAKGKCPLYLPVIDFCETLSYVLQAGLTDLPDSASWVLGLKICTIVPVDSSIFNSVNILCGRRPKLVHEL